MDSTKDTYQAPTALELRAALYDLTTLAEAGLRFKQPSNAERLKLTLAHANALLRGERIEIMSVLVVNSTHIKQETAEELDAADDRARLTWQHGNIVYIPEHTDDGDGPAWPDEREDLRPVFKFAKMRGFDWVRFDNDGPMVDGLPVFKWEG